MMFKGYDDWKLSSPDDDRCTIGTEPGQNCGRYAEPDEDAPRGYKHKPCRGEMICDDDVVICDTCGEVV